MKILLDTHIAIWLILDTKKLPDDIILDIENYDNDIFVSIVSVWEIAIKHLKSPEKIPIDEKKFVKYISEMDINILPIKISHISNLRFLKITNQKIEHNDPFDKMLISQASVEDMRLITKDKKFEYYNQNNIFCI